jgi:hypothetical protein
MYLVDQTRVVPAHLHAAESFAMNRCLVALVALATPCLLFAQSIDAIQAVALQPNEVLPLDGTLSHPAWRRAPIFERFIERDPVNGAAPPQATQVQVLFDSNAIYVGVAALDTQPSLIRDVLVRADQVSRSQDFVVVYIDAIAQRKSAQFFRVNAAGSTSDGMHTAADDREDFAPDFDWDAATARNAQGWSAVFRLPFASLRFSEGRLDWKIMAARRLPREQFHLIASVPIPRDSPSFIHTMQPLQGVVLPEEHSFLTVRPSLSSRARRDEAGVRNDVAASLDVKWRPRAELVFDATLNPDFSQVALDVPQLAGNTRFALSLPEKRAFFFESADLLSTPTDAFYTRSFTEPRWGVRATWRSPEWAGSGFLVDDRGGGVVLLPGPYGTGAVVQPASRSMAARVHGDQGSLQLGALVSSRRYADAAGQNDVVGVDGSWHGGGAWRARAQWLHSRTDAYTRRVDGDRVYAKLWRLTDESEMNIAVDDSGAGFRQDMGFVNQVGVRRVTGFASRTWHGLGRLNEFAINAQVEQVRDRALGQVVSQDFRPGIYVSAARNLEWWLEAHPLSMVRLTADAPLLHQRYLASGLAVSPAPWFPLLDTDFNIGRLADTVAGEVRPGLRWNLTAKLRPMSHLEAEATLSTAWLKNDGAKVYRETALQTLVVWHFDASHNLRAIVQSSSLDRRAEVSRSIAAQHDRSRAGSLTYTWRHSAGTMLYVGGGQARSGDGPVTREVFVKLQFDTDRLPGLLARP